MDNDQKIIDAKAIGNMLNEATLCESLDSTVHQFACLIDNGHSITDAADAAIKSLEEPDFLNIDFPAVS